MKKITKYAPRHESFTIYHLWKIWNLDENVKDVDHSEITACWIRSWFRSKLGEKNTKYIPRRESFGISLEDMHVCWFVCTCDCYLISRLPAAPSGSGTLLGRRASSVGSRARKGSWLHPNPPDAGTMIHFRLSSTYQASRLFSRSLNLVVSVQSWFIWPQIATLAGLVLLSVTSISLWFR
jgi:hypothetical protein